VGDLLPSVSELTGSKFFLSLQNWKCSSVRDVNVLHATAKIHPHSAGWQVLMSSPGCVCSNITSHYSLLELSLLLHLSIFSTHVKCVWWLPFPLYIDSILRTLHSNSELYIPNLKSHSSSCLKVLLYRTLNRVKAC